MALFNVWRWCAAWLLWPVWVAAQTSSPAPAPTTARDPDLFFEQFQRAARLVQENQLGEARVVLDLLVMGLGSSPWLDIALLKSAELRESAHPDDALEKYTLLTRRLNVAPYFQGDAERAKVFRAAIAGAIERGISRLRIQRVRQALADYYARYRQYPESLPKLSILGYISMEDVHDAAGRLLRYVPTGLQMTPNISYQQYELATVTAEPFVATTPRLAGISVARDQPRQYAALFPVPGQTELARVRENQTFNGMFVAAVTARGAILVTPERVLVLPAPEPVAP